MPNMVEKVSADNFTLAVGARGSLEFLSDQTICQSGSPTTGDADRRGLPAMAPWVPLPIPTPGTEENHTDEGALNEMPQEAEHYRPSLLN